MLKELSLSLFFIYSLGHVWLCVLKSYSKYFLKQNWIKEMQRTKNNRNNSKEEQS